MPATPADPPSRYTPLAGHLEALSSPTRLEMLHALRTPRALSDIRVSASASPRGETTGRPLSRQGVTFHLEILRAAGLVERLGGDAPARGDEYVLNHERLFALVDEVRGLAKLKPLGVDGAPRATVASEADPRARLAPKPRLALAYGRDDGIVFPLATAEGARTRIGRSPACEIRLDYDPYLSAEHCTLTRQEGGFLVEDLGSLNGTWVNWVRLEARRPRPLEPGDLLTVGHSVLALQA